MSPSVQSRVNSSRRHGFYDRDSCSPWVFEGHPLNLDKVPSRAEYGHPLKSDWNSGHIWAECGHINQELFWDMDFLLRCWGKFSIWYDWCCARDCTLHDISYGFHCSCCSVPIS